MNLKYYLRGLGAGIVVTAIIMGIATDNQKEKLSNAEIKARAAELGMVEKSSGLLSELEANEAEAPRPSETPKVTEAPQPSETPKVTEAPQPSETPKVTEAPQPSETPKMTETPAPSETPKVTETPAPSETPKMTEAPTKKPSFGMITIEINPGESSYTVCKRLAEKGLIASAADFDTYLCDRGLDKKLRAGSYEIPEDAEPEEIAEILTF